MRTTLMDDLSADGDMQVLTAKRHGMTWIVDDCDRLVWVQTTEWPEWDVFSDELGHLGAFQADTAVEAIEMARELLT